MEWAKKHIALIITIVLMIALILPLGINALYLISTDCEVLHKPSEWTMFWGGYLGAIISAGVAFIILQIQRKDNETQNKENRTKNEEENENNRKLQLNILRYQQEMQWLNAFRQISVEYVSAYNYNDLIRIVNVARRNPEQAFYDIAPLLERLAKCDMNLKYIGIRENGKGKLEHICDSTFILYNDVLYDIQYVFTYLIDNITNKQNLTFEAFCIESAKKDISDTMKLIIQQIAITKNLSIAQRFNDIAMKRIKIIEERAENIGNMFMGYIVEQQKRIDNILTENIN